MMCSTLRIPIGAVVSRDESEDNENLYTTTMDINLSTYGSLSYNDDDGYDDDDDFDDVDPEFEENVDSVNPAGEGGKYYFLRDEKCLRDTRETPLEVLNFRGYFRFFFADI